MNVLVSNDDGIKATGIIRLAEALSQLGNVYVCAPGSEKSAVGHGITVREPIKVKEMTFPGAKLAFSFSGTPADCVKIGLNLLKERGLAIDMIFAGINHGGNLGTDTLYSGTVAAAIEGNLCGYPAVAVSVNHHKAKHFDLACKLAQNACRNAYGKLDTRTVLNINTPDLPLEEIKGVKFTRLGNRQYKEWFPPEQDSEGNMQYWYKGEPIVYEGLADDIDVISMQDGYASITPLQYDLTNHKLIDQIKDWGID